MSLDDVEKWVVDRYGPITREQVDFEQFGMSIIAVAVPVWNGVSIGMGKSYQLAVHDLYLRLASEPKLKTNLSPWWYERFEQSRLGVKHGP